MKIPLPPLERHLVSNAHPYPFQIGLQVQELMQASLFHAMIADIAAGEYFRLPGSREKLEAMVVERGLETATLELGWTCLGKYKMLFEGAVHQNALVAMNSHWDWYIRSLGDFVRFARGTTESSLLTRQQENDFRRIGRLSITQQLDVLSLVCGIKFEIGAIELENLREMSLVRNLGLHNRWEVDAHYQKSTRMDAQEVGELRFVQVSELHAWHASWIAAISEAAKTIAVRFKDAPPYPADVT